jgi:hypothetical protein
VRIALAVSSRQWWQSSLIVGTPDPANQLVVRNVVEALLERSAAILFVSFNWRHSSPGARPAKTILCSGEGQAHLGFPRGHMRARQILILVAASQPMAVTPCPSAPRFTFWM